VPLSDIEADEYSRRVEDDSENEEFNSTQHVEAVYSATQPASYGPDRNLNEAVATQRLSDRLGTY
jgi:hypothetical protein